MQVNDEPSPQDAASFGLTSVGGWSVEAIQRQAAATLAEAQRQLAAFGQGAGQGAEATAGQAEEPVAGQGAAPGPASPAANAQTCEDISLETAGATSAAAPFAPIGPDELAAGAHNLFGTMVDSQHRFAQSATAELLQRVLRIYGIAGPQETSPAAAPDPASASPPSTSAGESADAVHQQDSPQKET